MLASPLGQASLAIAPVLFPLASRMAHKPLHSMLGCLTILSTVMLLCMQNSYNSGIGIIDTSLHNHLSTASESRLDAAYINAI